MTRASVSSEPTPSGSTTCSPTDSRGRCASRSFWNGRPSVFPGLTPGAAALAAERERQLADKDGAEVAQGQLLAHVLSSPRAGAHLVWAMLRPTGEALARFEEFRAAGELDLGMVLCDERAAPGIVELRNPRHLNAEDDSTLAPTETAVDLVLLDPDIEVGVMRGGPVDHPATRAGASSGRAST